MLLGFFTLDLKVLDATYVGAQHMHLPWTAGVRSAKVNPPKTACAPTPPPAALLQQHNRPDVSFAIEFMNSII